MDLDRARALLARTPELGAQPLRALAAAADGDLARALARREWRALALPPAAAQFLAAPDEAALAADLLWLSRAHVQVLLASDVGYPALLLQTADAPAALYVRGASELLGSAQLALVGSRHPSPEGVRSARDFAACFAGAGLTITAGLAAGIETAAHEGALGTDGATVAVCGVSLDQLSRLAQGSLPERIAAHGALISEVPPRTPVARQHFARRCRLISGLSLGTLVIEAARNSAPLLCARSATEQGREVFAIPGSIHDPRSRGPHELLRAGATLVEEAGDVWAQLRNSFPAEALTEPPRASIAAPELDKEYEMLLDAVGFEPATVDVLAARTQLPSESVASMLLILELQGRVAVLSGGRYGRTA